MKLPVPPGFVITTETCLDYFHSEDTDVVEPSKVGARGHVGMWASTITWHPYRGAQAPTIT